MKGSVVAEIQSLNNFFEVSKGSAGEVKNMYYIAEDQEYVVKDIAIDRRAKAQNLINGNAALIKYLKSYQ